MKKSILLCVLFPTLFFSQPAIQWKTAYGGSASDYGNSITQTTDGN